MKLPEGFLGGGATVDFQCEGRVNEGGRVMFTHDFETNSTTDEAPSSFINPSDIRDDRYYPSHKAVDFYHHYKEDIAFEDVFRRLQARREPCTSLTLW